MPQLKPETISMTGLNLFQHLCNLARLATSAYDGGSNSEVSNSIKLVFEFLPNVKLSYVTRGCSSMHAYLGVSHIGISGTFPSQHA